ncbi:ATP-binding protein [Methanothrix sp.]
MREYLRDLRQQGFKYFHDRTLTAAILDRITHHALIRNMNRKSFRRR